MPYIPPDVVQDKHDHKTMTVKEVVASRKAGRVFIFSISVIVIGGVLLASIALSLFMSQQKLTDLTRKHEEVWRGIHRNLDYIMGRSEVNPISTTTARSVQMATAKLIVKEFLLNAEINSIIADTKTQRGWLYVTQDKENAIISLDIDRKIRDKIDQFVTASPALVREGYSFWDAATIVNFHSGRFLQPLVIRANILSIIQSHNVKVISWILMSVGFLVLLGIWMVWAEFLRPNLINLEKTILSELQQAEAKELAQKQLAERERELRTILDNTPGMIAGLDHNYCYVTANKAYLENFKLGKETLLIGKHVKEALGEQQWQIVHPYMDKALKGKRATLD
ncbi:MAG: PAS domain-containing protein, partial [Gammaproteobacteria bacterium]|nr:PAS domain-containing protein [Gammaproteobacteria bacterium]